jgi:hypothetical protein
VKFETHKAIFDSIETVELPARVTPDEAKALVEWSNDFLELLNNPVSPRDGKTPIGQALRRAESVSFFGGVYGYDSLLKLPDGWVIYCDEEGDFGRALASAIFEHCFVEVVDID